MKKFIDESWLVLVMAVVFAGLLAVTEGALRDRIAENAAEALQAGILEVVPGTATSTPVQLEVETEVITVHKCTGESGELTGWAIEAVGFGFQDKIKMVFGVSADVDAITGLKVLDQKETPGLGDKITEATWRDQFKGLDARSATEAMKVVKQPRKDDKHEILALTGATISSEAVKKIMYDQLNKIREAIKNHKEQ